MKRIVLVIIAGLCFLQLNAQKLPNIQQAQLRAPAKIKIDGKTNEWGNALEAYNKPTQVYYSISNDLNNLYLAVNVKDFGTIKKILAAGITFSINEQSKKKDSNSVAFIFPYYGKGQKHLSISGELTSGYKMNLKLDSFANDYNRRIPAIFKLLGVRGLKDNNDGMVSIYNEQNLKVAALFSEEMIYNFELAIPLQLLGFNTNEKPKFNYNIQLNAQTAINGYEIKEFSGRPEILYYEDNKGERFIVLGPGRTAQEADAYYATDFWGEYTLTK